MPSTTKTIGTKTATVVSVEATTAAPTSVVPSTAAAVNVSPSLRRRKIDSRTTMELSTSMPIPSVRPPRDMMLSEMSRRYMHMNVAMTDRGIDVAMTTVLRKSRRNANRTRIARTPPMSAAFRTPSMACSMKSD